jgi:hypothetical protein
MAGYTRVEAMALCSKVREQGSALLSNTVRTQCLRCQRAAEGDPDLMNMSKKPGYLGCDLMNRLWARSGRAHTA